MSGTLDIFHLPGLADADVREWRTRELGGGAPALRWPVLVPGALAALAMRLVTAAERLGSVPAVEIAALLDRAVPLLESGPLRREVERALPAAIGCSPAMAMLVLDRMLDDWRQPALQHVLATIRPGGAAALDGFVEAGSGLRARAFGPRLALHVAAGNVPGVAVGSMLRTLLLRSATVVKTAAGEPVLAALFARALRDAAPELAAALAVTHWRGGEDVVEREALEAADVVVFHGGADAAAAWRTRVPAHTRLVEHGPKVSLGLIGAAALGDEPVARATAAAAARAVALFDQQGCVSPHVLYVESGAAVAPRAFAALLAAELQWLDEELPRGAIEPADAAAIVDARTAAEFRAIAGEEVDVHAGAGTRSTVIYEADPAFRPSCLNRLVYVKPVARLEDAVPQIAAFRSVVQTAAVAGAGARLESLAGALGAAGITRIAPLEDAPWPRPHAHHDGAGPLEELLRWVDLES